MKSPLLLAFIMISFAPTAGATTTTVVGAMSQTILAPEPVAEPTRQAWLDIGASSWSPNFVLPSQLSGANVPLQPNAPAFFGDYTFQLVPQNHDWNGKLGLGWLSLSRTAPLNLGTFTSSATESAQFLSVRIGVEYTPTALSTAALEPYAGFALLPSAVFTGESAFDNGSAYLGLPVEFSLGTRLELKAVGISWDDAAIDVGATETLGRIDGSSVNGFGVRAGLRVIL